MENRTVNLEELPIYSSLHFPVEKIPRDRPYAFINMVVTIDGKSVSGERGEPVHDLGSEVDHFLMRRIQNAADAVLIGASSQRSTPKITYGKRLIRIVVTRSGNLLYPSLFFDEAPDKAYVLCTEGCDVKNVPGWVKVIRCPVAEPGRRDIACLPARQAKRVNEMDSEGRGVGSMRAESEGKKEQGRASSASTEGKENERNEDFSSSLASSGESNRSLVQAGGDVGSSTPDLVDWKEAFRIFRQTFGIEKLLIEGGSDINGQLLVNDLIEEIFLTIAPKIKLGEHTPTFAGGHPLPRAHMLKFRLLEQHVAGEEIFLRYLRVRNE